MSHYIATLPKEMGSMKNLTKLGLEENPLVSLPPEIRSLPPGTLILDRLFNVDELISEFPSSYKPYVPGSLTSFVLFSEM